ncbi:SpoIIE family protein phosphatase [Streptomyces smaragdinus]|nr:SpoIIE family protein phosphatase [Streptomyces smaragdinus]
MADVISPRGGPLPVTGQDLPLSLRHQDGTTVDVKAEVMPLTEGSPGWSVVVTRLPTTDGCDESSVGQEPQGTGHDRCRTVDHALIRSLFNCSEVGLVVREPDTAARDAWCSPAFFGVEAGTRDGPVRIDLHEVLTDEDAAAIDGQLRQTLRTGEPVTGATGRARNRGAGDPDREVSLSAFPLTDRAGHPLGAAALLADTTRYHTAQRQLALLQTSARQLGRSLDVVRTAEHVTQLLVPEFTDWACVDLTDPVREGGEATRLVPGTPLRRVAAASAHGAWPTDIYQLGDRVRARDLESQALGGGGTVFVPDLDALRTRLEIDPERLRLLFPAVARSALFVPLWARGHVLGVLAVWRGKDRPPFTQDDVGIMESVASRTALSLDNARRYTRERRTVEHLQRSLLPPPVRRTSAAQSAGVHAPAGSAAGTGGSWYDVIRLSGARTAFVIGKVAGHGMHAVGAMGRLRSAVQTLADVDLPPEELLSHLDDLVTRIGRDEGRPPDPDTGSLHGATCLYVTYDPVTGQCLIASAGHPPPLLARHRTGTVTEVPVPTGPALGSTDRAPYEPAQLHLDPGDILTLHTGPPSPDTHDLHHLRDGARAAAHIDTPLTDVTDRLLHRLRKTSRTEDLAVLLARVERLPPTRTAYWELTADPTQVAHARTLVRSRLAGWGLEDLAFSTELIVSELVTNAIRYAYGPIGLRLIQDEQLICEVSDPSQSQPHLRRARLSEEGGRGLFLVAQLTERWGSRYTTRGKTIWTEQKYEAGG